MGPLNLGSAVRKDDTKPNWLTFMAFIIRALNGADTKQLLGEFRGGLWGLQMLDTGIWYNPISRISGAQI